MVTSVHFTGDFVGRQGRTLERIVGPPSAATGSRFLGLLNSHFEFLELVQF